MVRNEKHIFIIYQVKYSAMKNSRQLLLRRFLTITMFCSLVILSCEKETPPQNDSNQLNYIATKYEDCNKSSRATTKAESQLIPNEVDFSRNADTLQINVQLNYLCCALFDSKATMVKDTLHLEIMDMTSEFQKSHCRCRCNYGFTFFFHQKSPTSIPLTINFVTNKNKKGDTIYHGMIAKEEG